MTPGQAIKNYRATNANSIIYQEPVKLICKLYDTALERITIARNNIRNRQVSDKCENLDRAMKIIDSLRLHLDREKGGPIAEHLEQIYDYANRRLLYANQNNDEQALVEVLSLLGELGQAWAIISRTNSSTVPGKVTEQGYSNHAV